MLKGILEVLLTKEGIAAMVRHAIGALGGWLSTTGLFTDPEIEQGLAGIGLLAIAALWSLAQKYLSRQA